MSTNPQPQAGPQSPRLIIVLLDQQTNLFKVLTDQTLKLQQNPNTPGVVSLGYIEARPRLGDGNVPLLKDGKPEMEVVFTPVINYPGNLTQPQKIEIANDVPASLKKTSKVGKKRLAN